MKTTLKLFILLFATVLFVSCDIGSDEHISYYSDSEKYHIGDIYCSNGAVVTLDQYIEDSLNNGVGVVYATQKNVSSLPCKALIVYKDLISSTYYYKGEENATLGCSTDTATYDGFSNTYILSGSFGEMASSGLGLSSQSISSVTGQHLIIPSVAEMKLLNRSSCWTKVNTSLQAIGGFEFDTALENSWFWTSTEINSLDSYTYSPLQDMLMPTSKDCKYPAIAIIYGY